MLSVTCFMPVLRMSVLVLLVVITAGTEVRRGERSAIAYDARSNRNEVAESGDDLRAELAQGAVPHGCGWE